MLPSTRYLYKAQMKCFLLATVSAAILLFSPPEARSQAQFLNNSPDPLFAKITIEHRGRILVEALEYRHATPFIAVAIGNFDTLTVISDLQPGNRHVVPIVADGSVPLRVIIQGVGKPSDFAVNPAGRDIALSMYCQNVNIESEMVTEVEMMFQFGSPDAPICSLNAMGVAPLIRKSSFGDAAPFLIPMPAMHYDIALVEESEIPSVRYVFKVDLSDWGGKTGACVLSGFWNPVANGGGKSLALLFVNSDGDVREYPAITTTAVGEELNPNIDQAKLSFYGASERIVWNMPHIASVRLYSNLGAIAALADGNSVSTINLPNGPYFYIGTSSSGSIFFGRILICR